MYKLRDRNITEKISNKYINYNHTYSRNNNFNNRGKTIFVVVIVLIILIITLLRIFNDNITFFLKPSELVDKILIMDEDKIPSKEWRLGGVVKDGSLIYDKAKEEYRFLMIDDNVEMQIEYKGVLPMLFKQGQVAVVNGHIHLLSNCLKKNSIENNSIENIEKNIENNTGENVQENITIDILASDINIDNVKNTSDDANKISDTDYGYNEINNSKNIIINNVCDFKNSKKILFIGNEVLAKHDENYKPLDNFSK